MKININYLKFVLKSRIFILISSEIIIYNMEKFNFSAHKFLIKLRWSFSGRKKNLIYFKLSNPLSFNPINYCN